MADPTVVSGQLSNPGIDDFSGMFVDARYALLADGVASPTRQGVQAAKDGAFRLELPELAQWQGPLSLVVTAPSGAVVGALEDVPGTTFTDLEVEVDKDVDAAVVLPSGDPTLGSFARFTGRVIDRKGNPQRAGLLVVLWGVAPASNDPYALTVAETAVGGYFAGEWPTDVLASAFARVGGGAPVAIPLDGDRLPRRIVVVIDEAPAADGSTKPTPRPASPEELAAQPEAFSNDAGCCATFTTPNRTVEEVEFHAVVRTTQPEVRGSSRPPHRPVPTSLVDRLTILARSQPRIMDALHEPATEAQPPASRATARLMSAAVTRGTSLMGVADAAAAQPRAVHSASTSFDARAASILAGRDTAAEPIRLEPSVLADLARERTELTPARLLQAERTSIVRHFRGRVDALFGAAPARFDLNADHQADWDNVPYAYQATTVAHGHLLSMKQVWRADGYSLGDVLYSLPLAPGQQKLISILDWERREETSRTEARRLTEDVSASLAHDRDISDIVRTALHERMDARSRANVSSIATVGGGYVGPIVFGSAGGTSTASSSAQQASSRDITATALNSARDRTLQAASSLRGQRATVVQTARQGESVRAQTEAIANNNHCHALTIEYFEVLRHFQVSQELAHVQECLFVPFAISRFNEAKAARWRHVLEGLTIRFGGKAVALRPLFDSLDRVNDNWAHVDYPLQRYADDVLRDLNGDFQVRMSIPRPADTDTNEFDAGTWGSYQQILGAADAAALEDIWKQYMGVALPENRAAIWNSRLAPAVARRMIDSIVVDLFQDDGTLLDDVALDATLVSPFRQGAWLLATFRAAGGTPTVPRASVARVRLRFNGIPVPTQVEVIVESGSMRYRTDHMTHALFEDHRIQNDLGAADPVEVPTPLDKAEKVNPRQTDRKQVRLLLDVLNERVEYMHRLIWLTMDPNRRYMFLDGVIAPDAGGRSVASVVENRLIGIVGNSLVMPVVPGLKLDPTYEFGAETQKDLREHYAADPPPPMRISTPTRGVFAEAVLGKCNSCEKIDQRRFWNWAEAPIPDSPTAILPLSTESRRTTPPSLLPSDFPEALVRLQATPGAPDPTGLSAALSLLGTKDLFRNLTGLALNQENAASALRTVMSAAQSFASQGAALAQQKFLAGSLDRNLDLIKKARERKQITPEQAEKMTESLFRGALGERRPDAVPVTENPSVKRNMDRVATSKNGEMRITRPGGSVEITQGSATTGTGVNAAVDPAVSPIQQPSSMVCWATVGTMLVNWKTRTSKSITDVLDGLGGGWRAKFDANQPVNAIELLAFHEALGLKQEGPASYSVEGLARLLQSRGPLLVISDDDFDGNMFTHARIVTEVHGDGSPEGTTVTLADPATGGFTSESFVRFAERLEARDTVNTGVGIFHW